jgi:hypothetical protein
LFFSLSVHPYHLNLSKCINSTMFALCNVSCISLFVIILQLLLLLWLDHHIFLHSLLSNAFRSFVSSQVNVQASAS